MAITASVHAARIGPDSIFRIRLPASVSDPFFQRRHESSGWPGQGLAKRLWSGIAGVQESSGPVSGRTQPARYQFPAFRLGYVLPLASRIILCKISPDPI